MLRRLAPLSILVALAALAALAYARVDRELATPFNVATATYQTSQTCKGCHPDNHETWYRTFHRTMTQNATPESVVGDFDNRELTFEGVTSRFFRSGDQFFIETLGPDNQLQQFPIVRTVGSRRIQQYVTKIGDRHLRLPLAWNILESRWIHLNGGFLDPDGTAFTRHTALWDANCIFCHNTGTSPNYDWSARTFASTVEELGIACEACHGPGEEHIRRNSNPLRRYVLHYSDRDDPTIINPRDLPKVEQVQVCGHCHGQRLPNPTERIREFMSEGDPYTPGENLHNYIEPLQRHSSLPGVDVTARFWNDGTPRLTAYEYQGLLMSKDFQKGNLTCLSCHEAHGGDPKGMITDQMRGPAACVSCHESIVKDAATHAKHKAGASGTDCYACHMPKITYGLLDVHPTHRITNPDPSRAWRYDMPEACTLCHTDRSAKWAATEASRLYGTATPQLPQASQFDIAENLRALYAGDPVQRSVVAMAIGDARSYTTDPIERLWAVPHLIRVMRDDRYPAIRLFAWRSLERLLERAKGDARFATTLQRLPRFDNQAPPETRTAATAAWKAWWNALDKRGIRNPGPHVLLDAGFELRDDTVRELQAKQQNRTISIGE